MNSQVPYLLRDIVRKHGMNVVSSASRCDAYLADLLFEYRQERQDLVMAVRVGVIDALLLKKNSEQLHLVSKQLAKKTNLELAEALAIINAWRFALSDNPLTMEVIQPAQRSGLWALMVGLSCCLVLGGAAWLASQYWPLNTWWGSTNSVPITVTAVETPTPAGEVVPVDEELESMLQETAAPETKTTSDTPSEDIYIESDDAPTVSNTLNNTTPSVSLPLELVENGLDESELAEKSNNALYALQRFANNAFTLQKKKKAQKAVGQLWQNTRQPYYQQQYQTLGKQIQDLEQQLENAALQYGAAMDSLCELAPNDRDRIPLSSRDALYKVMAEHLRRCKSGANTNRQQLEKDIQQFSATP